MSRPAASPTSTEAKPVGTSTSNVTIVRRRRDDPSDERVIHIVGTAHVSKKSVEEVRSVIREIKPDTVCVELDQSRYEALTDDTRWRKLDMFAVVARGDAFFVMATLILQTYQKRIGEKLGARPGAELLAAVETGREVGAEVVLADRDVGVTLRRTWANLGIVSKLKLLAGMVVGLFDIQEITEANVEALKDREHISDMMTEFARAVPEVKGPLIDERDAYMMSRIEEAPGRVLVAVVGSGHVAGMTEAAGKPVDREALSQLPAPSITSRIVRWLLPALVIAAFVWGYRESSAAMLLAWVQSNAIATALFTIAAGAKPLSIVTAVMVAPIAALVPVWSAGTVVGLVEARLRRPTPDDGARLGREVTSFTAMYKNPMSRILLVTIAATLGSALGSYIGAAWLLTLLL